MSLNIDAIKKNADIIHVAELVIKQPLEKRGKNYFTFCPVHSENTPSLSISPDKQIFKCFGCGIGGDVIQLVQYFENIPFKEAAKRVITLSNQSNIQEQQNEFPIIKPIPQYREKEVIKKVAAYYHVNLFSERGDHAREYLNKRGFTDSLLNQFKIGYAPQYIYKNGLLKLGTQEELNFLELLKGSVPIFIDRIIFPITENGKIISFQGRTVGNTKYAKYINIGNAHIWNKDIISSYDEIHICEGIIDALTLIGQAKIKNTVASLGVNGLTDELIDTLQSYPHIKKYYLWFDNDKAGIEGVERAARKLGEKAKIVRLKHANDVNSLYSLYNEDLYTFNQLIRKYTSQAINLLTYKSLQFEKESTKESKMQILIEIHELLKEYIKYTNN